MKNKKVMIPTLVALITLVAGALYIPVSRAATDMPLFGTTTLLGVNLLMGNSGGAQSVMTFVDFSGAPETDQNYTLPSTTGKQGQVIIVKGVNAEVGEDGTFLNIYPPTGQMLDNDPERDFIQVPAYSSVNATMFIADPARSTWWLISQS